MSTLIFDTDEKYIKWINKDFYINNFVPIRLSNNTFFNSLVCREKNQSVYQEKCTYEYTIIGTYEKKLRFSFKKGNIALSYLRTIVDKKTGYPLIIDDINYITAITYYIKWKIAERLLWHGRQGFGTISQDLERKWLKYSKQAVNNMKMPKSIDEYQNMLEETHQLIPKTRRYYNFFGNLGREETKKYNDPALRNKNKRRL